MLRRPIAKRLAVLGIALATVTAAAACGTDESPPDPTQTSTSPGSTPDPEETAEFEAGTVHILVPYSAGGGVDIASRQVANLLPPYLDATFVVENESGAGGRIAAARFQNAAADGSYIWSDVLPSASVSQLVYDGDHDVLSWVPIYGYSDDYSAVIVTEDSPYETFDELVEAIGEQPLTSAIPGIGTPIHLQSVVMQDALGIEYTDIPNEGTAGAFTALLGGNVDFVLGNVQNVFQYDGLRTLAVVGSERDDRIPDVPSTGELGYDVPVVPFARGFIGPPGMSDGIRDILATALEQVVASEEFKAFAEDNGYVLVPRDSAEFTDVVRQAHELAESFAPLLRASDG